jgi:hypothetical protein
MKCLPQGRNSKEYREEAVMLVNGVDFEGILGVVQGDLIY